MLSMCAVMVHAQCSGSGAIPPGSMVKAHPTCSTGVPAGAVTHEQHLTWSLTGTSWQHAWHVCSHDACSVQWQWLDLCPQQPSHDFRCDGCEFNGAALGAFEFLFP